MSRKSSEAQRRALKKHYEANKDYYKTKARKRQRETEAFVSSLKDKPCADCGEKYPPWVMDFDHVSGNKLADIATLVKTGSRSRLLAEIEKCEVVCANCHRQRTHDRIVEVEREAREAELRLFDL
jgi:hypothetical protein